MTKKVLSKSLEKYLSRIHTEVLNQNDPQANKQNTLFIIDKSPQYKKFFHEDNAFINQIYEVSDGWQGIDYQGKKFKLVVVDSRDDFYKIKQSQFTDYCIMANYEYAFNVAVSNILQNRLFPSHDHLSTLLKFSRS